MTLRLIKMNLIILVCIFHTTFCFAEIIETNESRIIEGHLQKVDENTLVIFDIDDVLIMPTDEFAFKTPIRKEIIKKMKEKYSKEQFKIFWSIMFEKRAVKLVDPNFLKILKDLASRKISVAALTGWWTGKYGKIEKMEDYRFKGLDPFGITFKETSPFKKEMTFLALKTEDGVPMIRSGIIFTALGDKGAILKEALKGLELFPEKIIFIDDSLENLEAVQKICHELGVGFQGIHYTAVNFIPLPVLGRRKETLRFEILEKEHKWLSDQDLKTRLYSTSS